MNKDDGRRGSPMHIWKEKRFRRTGPAPRTWVKFLLSLLIVAGLTFHMVHADPSFAGTEPAEATSVIFVPEQPHDATFAVSPAVPHCHLAASCAFLTVKNFALFRAPKSGGWIPGPPQYHRSTNIDRQFRPPRLPAHV